MNTGPSAELVQEMYDYYLEGKSLMKVGERFHYTDAAVHYQFKKHGFPTRKPRETCSLRVIAQTQQMHDDYMKGLSLAAVGRKWGFSEATVWHRFKRYNLPTRTWAEAGVFRAGEA